MKNEARLRLVKRAFGTWKDPGALRFIRRSKCFIEAVKLLLHICEANASFFASLFTFYWFYGIIMLGITSTNLDLRMFLNEQKQEEAKRKAVHIVKKKPYTIKQENDIALGKVLSWGFLISIPTTLLFALIMPRKEKVCLLLVGISCLLFALYNLLGIIFKWDHARVCAKNILKNKFRFDVRNAWTKVDTKDGISVAVIWGIVGVFFLIASFIC